MRTKMTLAHIGIGFLLAIATVVPGIAVHADSKSGHFSQRSVEPALEPGLRGAGGVTAGAWQDGFTMANGCSWQVVSMAEGPDGKLYIAGAPQVCGAVAGALYVYDPVTNQFGTHGDFTNDSGTATSSSDVTVTGDDLYVVGNFDRVDGMLVNGVAHYDFSTQMWSSLGTGAENGVTGGLAWRVAADANSVYLAFLNASDSAVGTQTVNGIARWNVVNETWSAMNGGVDRPSSGTPTENIARVSALLLDGGTLYVGGRFDSAGGASMPNVASFAPMSGWSALGPGVDGAVGALARDGTRLFVAGLFTEALTSATTNLLEFDGGQWLSVAPQLDGVGFFTGAAGSLLTSDGFLYLGGWFTSVDGVAARNIARLDLNTDTWQTLGAGAANGVRDSVVSGLFQIAADALALLGDDIVVGGHLTGAGGEPAANIARWDPATGDWNSLGASAGDGISAQEVWSLATTGSEVLALGPLSLAGSERTNGVARRDIADGPWSAFGNASTRDFFGIGGRIASVDGEIFVSVPRLTDSIDSYSTLEATNGIVRWDPVAQDWALMGPTGSEGLTSGGAAASAGSIAGGNGALYVSGSFDMAGATPASNIARWDVSGQSWSALGSGLDALASELLVAPNGDVYAAGPFTSAGGLPTEGIAKWDPDTSSWSAFGTGLSNLDGSDPLVRDLEMLPSGDMIIAGEFDTAGSVAVNSIARWDGTEWHSLGDGLTDSSGDPARVEGLAVGDNGDLFAGGNFTQSGMQPLGKLARWDGAGWSIVGPSLGESGIEGVMVDALALLGPDLFVGGDFGRAGGLVAANFAHFVRDLGGPVLVMTVSSGGAAPAAATRGAVNPVIYTVTIENLGENNAFETVFNVELTPAPMGVSWTCMPLPDSSASCPQPSGTGGPNLLVDLPFGSGLSFELTVDPAAATVFQDLDASATAPVQFGDPADGAATASGTAPVSIEAVFKNDFES